jgi:hypothetical protein
MASAAANGDAAAPNGHADPPEEEQHEIRAVETDPSKRYTRVSGRGGVRARGGCGRARAPFFDAAAAAGGGGGGLLFGSPV